MASRGLVVRSAVTLLLLTVLLPAASSQPVPALPPAPPLPLDHASDHMVVAVDVPLAGAAGSGSVQVPVDGGILDIRVDPILLPGPGGTVDVEAYLAQVRLLLPSGVSLPLPSMIIRSEDRAIDGPAGQALAELAASAAALQVELEALAEELTAPSDPEPEPGTEPEPEEPDAVGEQLSALQVQAEALAAEASWVKALADEAAGAAGAGAAEQTAIAGAMLARVEAGLALLQKGLDSLEAEASALADEAGVSAPETPSLPSGDGPSDTGSASEDPDPSSSQAPPSTPPAPDLASHLEAVMSAIDEAQAEAALTVAMAQAARDELAGMAGAVGEDLVAEADALVDEQAAIDGARAAVALAGQAIADQQAGAQAMLAELEAELRAAAEQQSQGPRDEADAAALEAQAALDEAIARLQWASDWVAEAQAMAGAASDESLADASRSIGSAQRTAEAVAAIVERYASSQSPDEAEQLASQIDAAVQQLDGAVAEAEAAQASLVAALEDVAAQDPAGGLGPLPGGDSLPGAPGAPEVPILPSLPGAPVSFDDETMAVCVDSLASQACFHYRSPVDSPPGSLRVLVAIPAGPGSLDDPDLPVDPPVDVPVDPDAPLPVPMPTGLPILGSGSASSSSPAPSEEPGSESSSSSASLLPEEESSSSSSSAAPAARPHLQAQADRDTLGLRMGGQDALVLSVRNDGTAADTVRITAQTDAPIAFDATDDAVHLAPGQQHDFVVRITPLAAGSGTIDLLATGDKAGTVVDSVLVSVQAAPDAPAADIAASLDPTAVQSAVGQATAVTIRLANEGRAVDLVTVDISGKDMAVEPSQLKVLLQPGEAAARQVWITPTAEGASQVVMSITSDRGADLQPIVLMDAVGSLAAMDDVDSDPQDEETEPSSKDSPGLGLLLTGVAVAFAMLARRKLRKA